MKKIIASAGLVAVSATGLYGQGAAPAETRQITTKPWHVSAALRGFYDDNIVSAPNDQLLPNGQRRKEDSFGIDLRPSASVNLRQADQTSFGASYTYGMKWYESRTGDSVDHSHEADFRFLHQFSPRYKISANDSFVYAQEPELVDGFGVAQTFLRQDLSVIRNRGSVEVSGMFTERLGAAVGYQNAYYNFLEAPLEIVLDRVEHLIRLDGRYQAQPDLVGILGYQFGITDYSDDRLLPGPAGLLGFRGSDRSSESHYGYVGAEYNLTKKLSARGRAGVVYTVYEDILNTSDEVSPYADVSATYRYRPNSIVQVGVRQERNATDQTFGFGVASLVLDQDSTVLYGTISHRLATKITGSLLGQFTHSVYNGGGLNDLVDNFYTLGVNLRYQINDMFSAETGYNFDRLDSDLGSVARSFTRNRVYVGVRAAY